MGLDKIIDIIMSMWARIQPIFFILEYEQAVVLRGGKFHTVWNAGPHLRIPGIDIVTTTNIKPGSICIREVNATTKDSKSISIAGQFFYRITDLEAATVNTNDWMAVIVNVGRKIMSEELSKYNWENIFTGDVAEQVGKLIKKEAELLGIEIWNFGFTDQLIIKGFKLFNA